MKATLEELTVRVFDAISRGEDSIDQENLRRGASFSQSLIELVSVR